MDIIQANRIFFINDQSDFTEIALEVFRYQYQNCEVYREFTNALRIDPSGVRKLEDIPFLPIQFFKTHRVVSGGAIPTAIFTSSSTGGIPSRHFVKELSIYEQSFRKGFELFYGDISEYTVLALLPSYQERSGSSLIYMVDDLIRESRQPDSGYFLHNHEELKDTLTKLQKGGKRTILIGVTYALLDFIENYKLSFPELIIMETGGMKGRRKELIREELHEILSEGFGVPSIHSEYGMTELLSQAYSLGEGIFSCPPWMKVAIRDTNDPLSGLRAGQAGGINVIDLANLNSCSFIATQDLGRILPDGRFEVLGRFDNSDIRGCNLMIG